MLNQDKLARPFNFDLDLDVEGQEIQQKLDDRRHRVDALDEPPILVTEEEALNWKQQGYDSGYASGSQDGHKAGFAEGRAQGQGEGKAEALQSIEQTISDQLEVLSRKLDEGRSQFAVLDERFEMSAITVAIKLLHLFTPVAARNNALDEVQGVIDQTLRDLIHEPKLIIKVTEALRQPLADRIDALIAAHGFDGKITVLGDEALVNADLVIQWEDGGIERTEANIWNTLNEGLERLFGKAPMGSTDLDETVKSLVEDMEPDAHNLKPSDDTTEFAQDGAGPIEPPSEVEQSLTASAPPQAEQAMSEQNEPEQPEQTTPKQDPENESQTVSERPPQEGDAHQRDQQGPEPDETESQPLTEHCLPDPKSASDTELTENHADWMAADQEPDTESSIEIGAPPPSTAPDHSDDASEHAGLQTRDSADARTAALGESDLEDWTDAADWDQQ